jgi:hypothetical protein
MIFFYEELLVDSNGVLRVRRGIINEDGTGSLYEIVGFKEEFHSLNDDYAIYPVYVKNKITG